MNVVGTLAPESWITVVGVNPVPVTTSVTADEPAGTSLGVTDEMASGFALPPAPEAVPEFAGAAPHPESRITRRQKDRTRRKEPKGPEKWIFIWRAQTIGTPAGGQAKNIQRDQWSKTAEIS